MEKEMYKELYDAADRSIMKLAEDSLNPRVERANELVNFAKMAGINTIGIANCISFEKEGGLLQTHFEKEGMKVVRANCKLGRMPNDDIMPGYRGISCNPAGQANFLNEGKTELNIVMGLCIGHDMVFQSKSDAPSSTLIVKDRKLNHKPLDFFNPDME